MAFPLTVIDESDLDELVAEESRAERADALAFEPQWIQGHYPVEPLSQAAFDRAEANYDYEMSEGGRPPRTEPEYQCPTEGSWWANSRELHDRECNLCLDEETTA